MVATDGLARLRRPYRPPTFNATAQCASAFQSDSAPKRHLALVTTPEETREPVAGSFRSCFPRPRRIALGTASLLQSAEGDDRAARSRAGDDGVAAPPLAWQAEQAG